MVRRVQLVSQFLAAALLNWNAMPRGRGVGCSGCSHDQRAWAWTCAFINKRQHHHVHACTYIVHTLAGHLWSTAPDPGHPSQMRGFAFGMLGRRKAGVLPSAAPGGLVINGFGGGDGAAGEVKILENLCSL